MAPIDQAASSGPSKGGNKKALLIAVRRVHSGGFAILPWVHRDAVQLQRLLIDVFGYPEDKVIIMMDDKDHPKGLWPTKINIKKQIQLFVQGVSPEDHLFFYYTGHGQQVTCSHDSEVDGMDEAILPGDGRLIRDNDLKKWLVDPLPSGCKLFALWDSCHSGTILDLDHHMCNDPELQGPEGEPPKHRSRPRLAFMKDRKTSTEPQGHPADRAPSILTAASTESLFTWSKWIPSEALPIQRTHSPIPRFKCDGRCERPVAGGKDRAYVVSLSACRDNESAYDDDSKKTTVTSYFVDHLRENPKLTLLQLLIAVRTHVNEVTEARQEFDKQTKVVSWRHTIEKDKVSPVRRNQEVDVHTVDEFLRAPRLVIHEEDGRKFSILQKPGYSSHYRLDLDELVDL